MSGSVGCGHVHAPERDAVVLRRGCGESLQPAVGRAGGYDRMQGEGGGVVDPQDALAAEVLSYRRHETSRRSDAVCRTDGGKGTISNPGRGDIAAGQAQQGGRRPQQTALGVIDDPSRFKSSRAVGAYLGLTPRRYQSGERDVSGRISKRGDSTMRTLLYEAAMSLITRVRACAGGPLQAWAHALRDRVGHKKACVALARRIGVLLHRMWMDGSTFELRSCRPLPN